MVTLSAWGSRVLSILSIPSLFFPLYGELTTQQSQNWSSGVVGSVLLMTGALGYRLGRIAKEGGLLEFNFPIKKVGKVGRSIFGTPYRLWM